LARLSIWACEAAALLFVSIGAGRPGASLGSPPTSGVMIDAGSARSSPGRRIPSAYRWLRGTESRRLPARRQSRRRPDTFTHPRGRTGLSPCREAIECARGGAAPQGARARFPQQVAKNADPVRRGAARAQTVFEAYFTVLFELICRSGILEVLPDVANWGWVFGSKAASSGLREPAAKLTHRCRPCSLAVLPNPYPPEADRPSAYVEGRRAWILRRWPNWRHGARGRALAAAAEVPAALLSRLLSAGLTTISPATFVAPAVTSDTDRRPAGASRPSRADVPTRGD